MLVIDFLIVGTAFSAFLVGSAELFLQKKKAVHYFSSATYFVCGSAIIVDVINHTSLYQSYPYFAYVNDSLEMIMAALFYYYFRTMFEPRKSLLSWELFLFAPAIFTIAMYLPLYMKSAAFKRGHYPIYNLGDVPFRQFYFAVNHFEVVWIIFCLMLALYRLHFFSRLKIDETSVSQKVKAQKRAMLIYCFSWAFVLCFFCYVSFFPNRLFQRLTILSSCILGCMLFIVHYKYKEFVESVQLQLNELKYRKSQIQGIDVNIVALRLQELMEDERLYTDETITLQKLSERLGLTPHQLSEILNKKMNQNFKSFLNSYRIEAAKGMLSNSDAAIIAIAYECGFNSKTSFNALFAKMTGMTPSDFRNSRKNH
jgi:AraC-like DNA-binding protein